MPPPCVGRAASAEGQHLAGSDDVPVIESHETYIQVGEVGGLVVSRQQLLMASASAAQNSKTQAA